MLSIRYCWRDDQGNVIKKVNINEFGEVITSNRKVLINKLYEKFINLGGEIKFNHELLDIIKKRISFQKSEKYSVDYIAGCDGIKSLIRTNKIKKDKITFQAIPRGEVLVRPIAKDKYISR